ncbi:hypothetical protein JRO89_XS01G0257400 [Xanthoceras sorbifolium]|uniref:Thioesterase domain-containing protein n=1 Tax=Xanthoceras sorbifolium TaxID=99658 RepID=A0ABQ8ILF6_9ROSI|nr:hypothetical protein JRO89_XS01G0257400 [Xanthoceras sorbifolium]
MEEESRVQTSVRWLQGLAEGVLGGEFEALMLAGLEVVEARESFIRYSDSYVCGFCNARTKDESGNWQVGAMATLIDDVGAAAIYSLVGYVKLSVDFNISFYSTAKIQEEIEIEAKVIGDRGKLTSVQVEKSVKWLQDLSEGAISHDLEVTPSKLVKATSADKDGNWQVGAMATLVDAVGAATVYSFAGRVKATADFNISFYSTAMIQEEVEIEAMVVGDRRKLTGVKVMVRRKDNGQLLARGKQWMAQVSML